MAKAEKRTKCYKCRVHKPGILFLQSGKGKGVYACAKHDENIYAPTQREGAGILTQFIGL